MKKRYIIKNLIFEGYWEKDSKTFKGILYATQFINYEQALKELSKIDYDILTIIEIFI